MRGYPIIRIKKGILFIFYFYIFSFMSSIIFFPFSFKHGSLLGTLVSLLLTLWTKNKEKNKFF